MQTSSKPDKKSSISKPDKKLTLFESTPLGELLEEKDIEKNIINFRGFIFVLLKNIQEIVYYCSNYEQNLELDITQFEKISKEANESISKIVNSRTITDCCKSIENFKQAFMEFSDYFKQIQNELFKNIKNSISEELFNDDDFEIDIDTSEKQWKVVFNSLKRKRDTISDIDKDKVEACYATSMIDQTIVDLSSLYESFPKPPTEEEIITYFKEKEIENKNALNECKSKLDEKDEQLKKSLKEQQESLLELMQSKKQIEVLTIENNDLQSNLKNFKTRCMELEKHQALLMKQISELQSQLKEAQDNPIQKIDQSDLKQIKERYITVLRHVRDITNLAD